MISRAAEAAATKPAVKVSDAIEALRGVDGGKSADLFRAAFERTAPGMDSATPLADYVDQVAGRTAAWLRALPGSKTSEWRAFKSAMMALREVPAVVDSVGKKLGRMETALKKGLTNMALNEEQARRTDSETGAAGEQDDSDSSAGSGVPHYAERLQSAVLAYCAATESLAAVSAMLEELWLPEVPPETVDKIEAVFREVAAGDDVALRVLDVLRVPPPAPATP